MDEHDRSKEERYILLLLIVIDAFTLPFYEVLTHTLRPPVFLYRINNLGSGTTRRLLLGLGSFIKKLIPKGRILTQTYSLLHNVLCI